MTSEFPLLACPDFYREVGVGVCCDSKRISMCDSIGIFLYPNCLLVICLLFQWYALVSWSH